MSIVVAQIAKGHASGFPNSLATSAFGTPTTTGNSIIVGIQTQSGANDISSVTDTQGNTYARKAQANNGSSVNLEIWQAQNITGSSSNVVTANDSGFLIGTIIAFEVAGLATSGSFDKSASNTGTGNGNLDSGNTANTTNSNEILIGLGTITSNSANTWTVGTGYSNLTSDVGSGANYNTAMEDKIVSATGAYNATLTASITNQTWVMLMATFSDTTISSGISINVSDSVAVTESVGRMADESINRSDSITVAENKSATQVYNASVSDSMTITESIGRMEEGNISKSDSISVTENPNVATVFNVHVEPGIQDISGPRIV